MADTLVVLPAGAINAERGAFGLPSHTVVGSASGASTATFTAAGAGLSWFLGLVVVSFSATTTGASTFTVKDGSGGTVLFQVEIPIATIQPVIIDFSFARLHGSQNVALVLGNTSPGAITCTISATGFTGRGP
jgi:hypothetical protein